MAESKVGSFSAYLEYAQRSSSEAPRPAPAPTPALGPTSLLAILNQGKPEGTSMDMLAQSSGMSATLFHGSLKQLSDLGFIETSGQPLPDLVKLTAKGSDAAALLKT
jgi:predicted transcriptional regulator